MMVIATLIQQPSWTWRILLFEKNSSLWAKVIISWWGRCNLTTWFIKKQILKKAYTRGWDFLSYAMSQFWPRQVRKRFEQQWVACKQESDYRVFPVSNDGKEVVSIFTQIFSRWSVQIHCKEPVTNVTYREEEKWYTINTDKGQYKVNNVVMTTWGNAYAHTGSSWDGYAFARACGHTITKLWPSLNSFMTHEQRLHGCSGVSFQEAKVSLKLSTGTIVTPVSPILLTHFWISWPLAFIVASLSAFEQVSKDDPLCIRCIPYAAYSYDSWSSFLLDASSTSPKKEIMTILSQLLPKRFCEHVLSQLGIDPRSQISILKKEDRKKLADRLGNWIPLSLIKRRPWDEFVTAWWVDTDQVNPKTWESTICPWLYFAWEILNVDWVTWWYNLQACWAMGRLVGRSITDS